MGYFSLPFILLEDINNMNNYRIITLRERPELVAIAAEWFHSKWGVPAEAYLECMKAYLSGKPSMVGIYAYMMNPLSQDLG